MGSKFSSRANKAKREEGKVYSDGYKKKLRQKLRMLKKKSSRETCKLSANGCLSIFLLGDKKTGKNSLLNCIRTSSTSHRNRVVTYVNINGHKFKSIIQIHDRSRMNLSKTDAVMLMYATCSALWQCKH